MNVLSNMQHAEDILRDREEDDMMNLTGEEKAMEETRVNERRAKWQRHFEAQKGRAQLQGQAPASSTTASMSSNTVIRNDSGALPQAPPHTSTNSTPTKRSWLWFKLKRKRRP